MKWLRVHLSIPMGLNNLIINTRLRYVWYKRKDNVFAADTSIAIALDNVLNYEFWSEFVVLKDVF
jgi:hypothetical protein